MIDTRTAAPSLPIETVTPIKPSEAIRLGCLLRGRQTTLHMDAAPDGACALGAMAFGFGWDGGENVDGYVFLVGRLPHGLTPPCGCDTIYDGGASWATCTGVSAVYHLNDSADRHEPWSRERIADWLEGLGL